jgi:hypothetical protein
MHDLEWYDDGCVMDSKQCEKKRPVLLYREVISSYLRGGIKENKETLS